MSYNKKEMIALAKTYEGASTFVKENYTNCVEAYHKNHLKDILSHIPIRGKKTKKETSRPKLPPELELIRRSGIYIQYLNNKIVYVGKSIDMCNRLKQHRLSEQIDVRAFDKIEAYCIKNTADIAIAEVYLINLYKPIRNSDCKENDIPTIRITNLDEIIDEKFTFNAL